MEYIKPSAIKRIVNERGFRCSRDFLEALDRLVYWKVSNACGTFNGHRKTLNAELLNIQTETINTSKSVQKRLRAMSNDGQ